MRASDQVGYVLLSLGFNMFLYIGHKTVERIFGIQLGGVTRREETIYFFICLFLIPHEF